MVAKPPGKAEQADAKPQVIGSLATTLQEGAKWAAWASLIIVPTTLVAVDKVAGAGIAAASIAASLLLLELPNLQSLSLGVLKAEMRKETWRAKEAADQANATVKQLRQVASLLARTMLGAVNGAGRWAGPDAREMRYAYRSRIVEGLKELGLTQEMLRGAVADFNMWVAVDLSSELRLEVTNALGKGAERTPLVKCLDTLRSPIGPTYASAAEHRLCFAGRLEITPEMEEWLLDLEYLQTRGELRRPEMFFRHV